jgi:nucleoside phosphorylase
VTTAFICAMPMEARPLVKKLALQKKTVGGVDVRAGTLGGRDVITFVTGMGTELARVGTRRLLDAVDVERVVVVGITGAVENVTPIGTLVLPEVVVNSATGEEHRPHPLLEGTPHGKMWTGDVLLTDPAVLADLRAKGVVSLDMETAVIAEECAARGIPWSVVRVISDRATDESIDEETFRLSNQDGTPNGPAIARYILRHPGRLPRMAKLAKGAKLATERAADTAIEACRQPTPPGLRARREAVVREHMESENRHEFDVTLGTFSHPRYELVATGQVYDGADEVREYFRTSRETFPDQRNENVTLRHADDAVIAEFDLLGTHRGGSDPTGNDFRCRMVALFLFDGSDGIVCERVYFDSATILAQLGVDRSA